MQALARTYGPHCIERLYRLTNNKSGKVAIMACIALLDRGFGKAVQPINDAFAQPVSGNKNLIDKMTVEELRILKEVGRRVLRRQGPLPTYMNDGTQLPPIKLVED
jgi:hypothetical protein